MFFLIDTETQDIVLLFAIQPLVKLFTYFNRVIL